MVLGAMAHLDAGSMSAESASKTHFFQILGDAPRAMTSSTTCAQGVFRSDLRIHEMQRLRWNRLRPFANIFNPLNEPFQGHGQPLLQEGEVFKVLRCEAASCKVQLASDMCGWLPKDVIDLCVGSECLKHSADPRTDLPIVDASSSSSVPPPLAPSTSSMHHGNPKFRLLTFGVGCFESRLYQGDARQDDDKANHPKHFQREL